MKLPFFYKEDILPAVAEVILDEATSKHVVQVLRMQNGEQLQITDGKGSLFTANITDNNRKRCAVQLTNQVRYPQPAPAVAIAISPLKNVHRFEWFLEKATEIGVAEIVPLKCERTEKVNIKEDRWKGILISAMLQSQQTWLPNLQPVEKFTTYIPRLHSAVKLIAHCEPGKKTQLGTIAGKENPVAILIGPEGDFSPAEIELALSMNFVPVALGNTRLRTETAGIVAATILCQP